MKRIRLVWGAYVQLFHAFWQLMYGVWRVSKLPEPRVTIFGGARFKVDTPYFIKAKELGQRLLALNISVLTGGGPGIMEAVSCGAVGPHKDAVRIMGVGVSGLDEKPNECAQEHFNLDYFFARKWILTNYSVAFVIFPGGFGTLDEMSEILTRIQTKKLKKVPIIFVGVEFWKPFMQWLSQGAFEHGVISKDDLKFFIVTDDLNEVCSVIEQQCKELL